MIYRINNKDQMVFDLVSKPIMRKLTINQKKRKEFLEKSNKQNLKYRGYINAR